jgi:hypothetical protein
MMGVLADAFIALPGGVGMLEELSCTPSRAVALRLFPKRPGATG